MPTDGAFQSLEELPCNGRITFHLLEGSNLNLFNFDPFRHKLMELILLPSQDSHGHQGLK